MSAPARRRLRAVLEGAAVTAAFALLAFAAHAVFVPQFFGLPFSPFTFYGGDATSQLVGAVSLLEQSLLDGTFFWNWEYGLGGDLFEQFSYYYSTSPFFYLMFAVKCLFGAAGGDFETTQMWRLIGSIAKQTICMLLMYALIRQEGKRRAWAVVAGAVYGCSMWYIDNSFAFDFMTDAMLWLPAIVMAFNHLKRSWDESEGEGGGAGRSGRPDPKTAWVPLLLVMALCLACNFYFAYISVLFCIVFALIFARPGTARDASGRKRAESREGRRARWIEGAKRIGVLAAVVVGALAVAAVAFVPSVAAFLGADRTQVAASFDLLPSLAFFAIVPEALFAKGGTYFATDSQTFAFPLFVLLALLIDYRRAPEAVRRKTALAAVLVAAWMVPAVSSAMNGFSYPSNRWCYLVVFAVAYAIPDWLDEIALQKAATPRALAVIAVLCALFWATHDLRVQLAAETLDYRFAGLGGSDLLMFALQFAAMGILAFMAHNADTPAGRPGNAHAAADRRAAALRFAPTALTCCIAASLMLSMPFGPYALASGFRDSSGAETVGTRDIPADEALDAIFEGDELTRTTYALLDEAGREPGAFFRSVDGQATISNKESFGHEARFENRSWLMGTHPVTVYNSMVEKDISRWIKLDHCISSTSVSASHYRGFGHRLFVENAWGVGWQFNTAESSNLYGYLPSSEVPGAYENENALGLDLWYSAFTRAEGAGDWTYAQKDAALMQTAVVDGETAALLAGAGLEESGIEDTVDAISVDAGSIALENCSLDDAVFEDGVLVSGMLTAQEGATISVRLPEQDAPGEYLLEFDMDNDGSSSWTMRAAGDSYWTGSAGHRWKYPIAEYALCYPAGTQERSELVLEVDPGTYEIANLRVEFSSYERLGDWTAQRNACGLEGLVVDGPHVSGSIHADEAGVLALSIPYSPDWRCTIDGKPAQTFAVNGVFTGVVVQPGDHQVEFAYVNRLAVACAAVSAAALAALAAWVGFVRIRRRRAVSRAGRSS